MLRAHASAVNSILVVAFEAQPEVCVAGAFWQMLGANASAVNSVLVFVFETRYRRFTLPRQSARARRLAIRESSSAGVARAGDRRQRSTPTVNVDSRHRRSAGTVNMIRSG